MVGKIFDEIKESLNISIEDTAFDTEISLYIDMVISILNQLGVGNTLNVDKETTWKDLKSQAPNNNFDLVKGYLLLKVRLLFDPPTASTLSHIENTMKEIEWRIKEAYTGNYIYQEGGLNNAD